ncbi:di-heme oxidoredictase family protein [Plastorhodobacter daqingensis]|uniref:Di-heme oxidoredictase family protein n=1 Tax=Plastorhodobacter daqingensis TaxID=1387281 RepID=A0ABW2UMX1_9RHOB
MRPAIWAAGVLALAGGALALDLPEVARITPARPDQAFATPASSAPGLAALDAQAGRALFDRLWVAAPASTRAADGLGPLYNARACSACHLNHGRAHPPDGDGPAPLGLVVRLAGDEGAPDPVLGHQIQPLATGGLPGEGRVDIAWVEHEVALADSTRVTLRQPEVALSDLAWGHPASATQMGLRAAPPLVGLGLIAAIDAADLMYMHAPGRVRMVTPLSGGAPVPGRFGRRAGVASLADATALALSIDMGLSTPFLTAPWGDCTDAQPACRSAPHGDGDTRVQEVAQNAVDLIAAHLASLAPPARRRAERSPEVARGEALFHTAGCASCHRPAYTIATPDGPRVIQPYSDFRLHDLGPGLAEAAPEAGISTGEWRTAPLWGLGHTAAVGDGRVSFLHDGRARTMLEAILWHGGAAQAARDRVTEMPAADRAALVAFLESL